MNPDIMVEYSPESVRVCVLAVLNYLQPQSVVQLGCGAGQWLAEFQHQGTQQILGINLQPIPESQLKIPHDCIQVQDFTRPLDLKQRFELAICLEIAGALPRDARVQIVKTLTQLSPVVLFSSTIPGLSRSKPEQGEWPDYWAAQFKQQGYCVIDCLREPLWQYPDVSPELAQNLLLFVDESALDQYPRLTQAKQQTRPYQLSLVHPTFYTQVVNRLWQQLQQTTLRVQHLLNAQPGPASTALNPQELHLQPGLLATLYSQEKWDQLSAELLKLLIYFEQNTFLELNPERQHVINVVIKNFLYFFTQPNYIINDQFTAQFLALNGLISNLVAISSFKTTDAFLEILKEQPNNFVKILVLYSARNRIQFDISVLFDTSAQLASLWYCHFFDIYYSLCAERNAYAHLKHHLNHLDDRLTRFSNFHHLSFSATYIDPKADKRFKQKINQNIQATICPSVTIINTPKRNKIAVISGNWFPSHSACRIQKDFVESLKDKFELVLVGFGGTLQNPDLTVFEEVIEIGLVNGVLDISRIEQNDFNLVYYPDVGMNLESIILSNLRLAPIQVTSYGHSVSTFGSEIDYFITGEDVELLDQLTENYSERVVLLPGLGITNMRPTYQLKNLYQPNQPLVINCSWYSQKTNYPMLMVLKEIEQAAHQPLIFRFFAGSGLGQQNNFLPFANAVRQALDPATVQIVPPQPYESYMALMEQGDFCLDPFHFGGCNTVVDSLILGKPIITWEGSKWYNRIGPAFLKQVGLEELVTTNQRDYIQLSLKLIQDANYRQSLQQKVQALDLDSLLFQTADCTMFKNAITYLINHHEQLQQENSHQPIRIKERL